MSRIDDLPTPSLLLDRDRLESNLRRMADRFRDVGISLRPHLKTAKCVEVARLAAGFGARCFTVSTVKEAEVFHAVGFDNLVYPATPVGEKLDRLAALIREGCRVIACVEQPAGARLVSEAGRRLGVTFELLIEIDSGEHRAGVSADSSLLLETARAMGSGASLAGVLTHAGHSYAGRSVAEMQAIAEQERQAAVGAAGVLRAAGYPCEIVSVGSTPTAVHGVSFEGITEVRAGVYMFGDAFQAGIGSHAVDEIAVSVLCSVIGHQPANHTVLVDAGAMALTKDRSTAALGDTGDIGYGMVCDLQGVVLPGTYVVSAHQEHGAIALREDVPLERFPLGCKLRIYPNHACMTAAQFDFYHVHQGAKVIDRWSRVRGW